MKRRLPEAVGKGFSSLLPILALMLCFQYSWTGLDLIPSLAQSGSASSEMVTIYVDGQELYCDVPARIENGRTMAPMRAVLDALGYHIDWDEKTQTVAATSQGEVEIVLTIGSKYPLVNGETRELDVPAYTVDDRTMVPVRFFSEVLGYDIEYDEASESVLITTEPATAPQAQYTTADYIPLAAGNGWDLSNGGLEDCGYTIKVLYASDPYYQVKWEIPGMSWDVAVMEQSGGKTAKIFSAMEAGLDETFTPEYYENLDLVHQEGFTSNDNRILLKDPVVVGTEWSDSHGDSDIVSVTETVVTPAGTFTDCVKVKRFSPESDIDVYDYYAPGVGPVRTDYVMRSGEMAFKSTLLEEYSVN